MPQRNINYIRENKLDQINIQYSKGSFVFDMGDDGGVQFNIKVLHEWKFFMWIEAGPEKLKERKGEKIV